MKTKNIFVLSKNSFDRFCSANEINDSSVEFYKEFAFISIHNTNDNYIYTFSKDHLNVLNLTFDDVDRDIPHKNVFAMTLSQAKILYEFIIRNSDKKNFAIHCTAGISRSGSVGIFIANYFDVDLNKFENDNPYILPNSHVLKMLNSAIL